MRGCDGRHQVLGRHLAWLAIAFDGDAGVVADEFGIAQAAERLFQMVFEDVGHGGEFDLFVAGEQVNDGLGAASAASYQAGFQRAVGSSYGRQFGESESRRAGEKGGLFDKIPAGDGIGILHVSTVSWRGVVGELNNACTHARLQRQIGDPVSELFRVGAGQAT